MIVSKGLVEYIVKLIIDKERKFTLHRAGKGKLIYADHYAMHFIMKGMPLKSPAMKKNSSQVIWNTNKPGGWKKYNEMTEHNTEIVEEAEKMT